MNKFKFRKIIDFFNYTCNYSCFAWNSVKSKRTRLYNISGEFEHYTSYIIFINESKWIKSSARRCSTSFNKRCFIISIWTISSLSSNASIQERFINFYMVWGCIEYLYIFPIFLFNSPVQFKCLQVIRYDLWYVWWISNWIVLDSVDIVRINELTQYN